MLNSRILAAGLLLSSFGAVAAEHQVIVDDDFFSPQHLTITAGDTVTWTNQGSNAHNVVEDNGTFRCAEGCDSPAAATGLLSYHEPEDSPGDPSSEPWSFSRTFNQAGEIGYYCEVHGSPGLGMFGTITVEEADSGGSEFAINFGLTGSWYDPATSGQGFLVDVVVSRMNVVVYWFTYDDDQIGGPEQTRWMIADGSYAEGERVVVLEVFQVTAGLFDDPAAVEVRTIGSAELEFHDCTTATLSYNLDFDGDEENNLTGEIEVVRLSPDVMCQTLVDESGDGDGDG